MYKRQVRSCNEGILEWVPKDELLDLPHWKGDEAFLKLIADSEQPFFSLKLVYDANDELVEASLDGEPLDLVDWNWA